ncbi:MAG TPA: hypothetical protein VLD16_12980 [Gaiellaceae bacterium]|nr:hypothetical protein [Gaiellaceae bacterium]
MSEVAVTRPTRPAELDANAVLKQAWALYRRLFGRSVLLGALVLGALHFLQALATFGRTGVLVSLLALVLGVAGIALLQGGLVEVVRGLHSDGSADASLGDVLARAGSRLWRLLAVSLLTGLGVGFGLLLLVVPGLVLMTRWALAVPVAMLEPGTARDALSRSREIVRGNGRNVFKVLFAVGVLTALVQVPFGLAAAGSGAFGWWLAVTTASALTAPYAAHALTVVYYELVEPGRPVVLEPGTRWQSIWDEQDAGPTDDAG